MPPMLFRYAELRLMLRFIIFRFDMLTRLRLPARLFTPFRTRICLRHAAFFSLFYLCYARCCIAAAIIAAAANRYC